MSDGRPPGAGTGDIAQPQLGAAGWARWAWRQLTSMRTALLLLVLLAVAAVPGSVWPQRRIDPGLVADYRLQHPTLGPWLDRLGFFDVYTSPWFSAVYLLLFVSLLGCVLPRAAAHWRALRTPPPATPTRLDRLPVHARRPVPAGREEQVLAAAEAALRRRRYRVRRLDGARGRPGASVAAEAGHLAETGNLVFHLALVGLLCALAWGSLASWSGQITVVEGRSVSNVVTSYDTFSPGRLVGTGELPPFSVRLDRLDVVFETDTSGSQLGAPRRFDATMTVTDAPGRAPRQVVVSPNNPLQVGGTRAFLVGNGYAPVLTVRDGRGQVAFSGPVTTRPMNGDYTSIMVVKVPDAQPRQIGLAGVFLPTYGVDADGVPVSRFPQALDPRVVVQVFVSAPGEDGLGVNTGVPQSVFRLDTRQMTRLDGADGGPLQLVLAPGTTADLPDGSGSVTFEGYSRFAALDVHDDPSRGWALATSALALAGLTASLHVRRRRVWVRVLPGTGDGPATLEAGALPRRDDPALVEEVDRLLADLLAAVAGPSTPGDSSGSARGQNESDPQALPREAETHWGRR